MKISTESNKILIELSDKEKMSDIQVRNRHFGGDSIQVWIKITENEIRS